jgi:16S rRNA (adenine1518-N6/adenine1519-N6)-dimethyltransferase
MTLLEETKQLLRRHRIAPKKSLGQNFMVESHFLQKIVTYASLNCDDTVLDVGAGLGFLASIMKDKCKSVIAVEADSSLASILREQFKHISNIRIVESDILTARVPSFNKVVSIPPYQISSRLLPWLFKRGFDCAVLVFQKEFVSRLVAPVGSDSYGWLTVLSYCHAEVELLDEIHSSKFYPKPKIDSMIIRLKPRTSRPFVVDNETSLRRLLQSLFTRRNKKVRNAALPYLKERGIPKEGAVKIADSLPLRDKRVRELTPEDFGVLANAITK